MGWNQPFHFQVDPLNLRLAWHLQLEVLEDEPCCMSLEAAAFLMAGRSGQGWSWCFLENRYQRA